MKSSLLVSGLLVMFCTSCFAGAQEAKRVDLYVESDPGIRIFVREIAVETAASQPPVLLIHGARMPGVASFDLPVAGGSLAADLARRGFRVYVMDVRGYGHSTRGPEFSQPPSSNPPLVRSPEAVRDIDAAVREIRKRSGGQRVALLGWATGGTWAGYYTSLHDDQVSRLILLNALFGADAPQPMVGHGSSLEDPQHPGQFNFAENGAYRCNAAASLLRAWDASIPLANKDEWRDPAVAKAYVAAAMASDDQTNAHNPPCFRSPNGALEDSFYEATGRQFWDASLITVPTLIVAGERDFWSRPQDREKLKMELVHAPEVRVLVIPNATHFVFLDRAKHGRKQFLDEVTGFLAK
jgi:pimeloyl-ACP methyl ester carboxylesterase